MARYCPNCGTRLNDVQDVCLNCGVRLKNNNNGEKSRVAAGLFGIFLGCLGVHNFYLGYNGKATTQLLMTVLSCGILSFASAIWGLIEGVMILSNSDYRDSNGNRLKD